MVIGTGTRSYEAGEIWHLLDTRIGMPITKLPVRNLSRVSLDPYNVLILVSGNYPESFQKRSKRLGRLEETHSSLLERVHLGRSILN